MHDGDNPIEKHAGEHAGKPCAKPYEPPKLIRVSLRPEEAVLGHCKITGQTGPVSGSCMTPTACSALGS